MKAPLENLGIEDVEIALAARDVAPADLGFELSPDYYRSVSGAQSLYVSSEKEDAFQLCARAAEKLLSRHDGLAARLDAIIVVTLPVGPTVAPISARLQARLGAPTATFCLDLTLSCVGFLQAASVALNLMAAREWENVLVLNAETLTKIIRPEDHALRLLMSDGASACLFSREPRLIFDRFAFFSDGRLSEVLGTRGASMHMDGPRLYETILRRIPDSFRQNLEAFGLAREDVDLFLFHQGSGKVLDRLVDTLGLDSNRVPRSIDRVGNLGSCSLPHLLARELEVSVSRECRMFATAFGAGFQWAHASLRQKR